MNEAQSSSVVLMARPRAFGFHAEAAASNAFAHAAADGDAARLALAEFDALAAALDGAGVETMILPEADGPDAVFPNNWVSFHADGTLVLYPMATAARRLERDCAGLIALLTGAGFGISRTVDLTAHEQEGRFLEGTGSLVLDRPRRLAFASRSVRTDPVVIASFDAALGYSTRLFDAFDRSSKPIYHSNVLLALGSRFAVLCSEAVAEPQRERLMGALDREIIDVNFDQMRAFACNLIELCGTAGPVIAMSASALASFTVDQRRRLERFGELLAVAVPTIEAVGGGSVRCMIADVHLPRR